MTPSGAERRLPYIGALDGLRALAVLAVLLYHLDSPWSPLHLRGGFFGVDVFFVLSGYLITSLLLSEWRDSTRVSLPTFWLRRARRLLPAVLFLLAVVLVYALVVLPDEVASLRKDAFASFGYVTNWYLILHSQSYFESWRRPSLFQHLWSLAIEEQFYLVWPLLFVIGIRFLRPTGMLIVTLAAAFGATLLMAAVYQPGVDPSRIYYGTDTRSAGLLIGSALAMILPASGETGERRHVWPVDLLGLAGLATLAYFVVRVGDASPQTYRGGFAIVSLATAAVVAATVGSRSRVGAVLGVEPLRWIGRRSYSIYLWHWPVFMLTRPELDISFGGWPLFVLRLAIVALLAEVSYRFVETPIRTGGLVRLWREVRDRLGASTDSGAGFAVAGTAALVLVMVVALWRADGPAQLASSSSIGVDLPSASGPIGPQAVAASEGATTHNSAARLATPPSTTTEAALVQAKTPAAQASLHCTKASEPGLAAICGTSTPSPTPGVSIAGEDVASAPPRITAIGDSVMLGASAQLSVGLRTVDIHAKVGMQASEGTDVLRQLQALGALGQVVVVHLGNNGEFNAEQLGEMMEVLKGTRLVIFVNLKVPRDWQDNNNHMLAEAVGRYPNARLLDWHAQSEQESEYFWNDGLHLRPAGALVYTALIGQEIDTDWPGLARSEAP